MSKMIAVPNRTTGERHVCLALLSVSTGHLRRGCANLLWSVVVGGLALGFVLGLPAAEGSAADLAAEIKTVLPPDAIPAILQPEFVPAQEAQVEAVAAMIGVVLNGEAHAYSAVLLNSHEIVNDTIGGIKVATTW